MPHGLTLRILSHPQALAYSVCLVVLGGTTGSFPLTSRFHWPTFPHLRGSLGGRRAAAGLGLARSHVQSSARGDAQCLPDEVRVVGALHGEMQVDGVVALLTSCLEDCSSITSYCQPGSGLTGQAQAGPGSLGQSHAAGLIIHPALPYT